MATVVVLPALALALALLRRVLVALPPALPLLQQQPDGGGGRKGGYQRRSQIAVIHHINVHIFPNFLKVLFHFD